MAAQAHARKAAELARVRERRGYYYDPCLKAYVHKRDKPPAVQRQVDEKCRCCGSQEVRQHNQRTICAYCRSNV